MKKQEIEIEVDYSLKWLRTVELSQIKKDVEEMEKLGVTHVPMVYHSFDDDEICFKPIIIRLETDGEFAQRIKLEVNILEEAKRREIDTYNRIKLKYNL